MGMVLALVHWSRLLQGVYESCESASVDVVPYCLLTNSTIPRVSQVLAYYILDRLHPEDTSDVLRRRAQAKISHAIDTDSKAHRRGPLLLLTCLLFTFDTLLDIIIDTLHVMCHDVCSQPRFD